MKKALFLMMIVFGAAAFTSCSDDDDNTNLAKEIAGTYYGNTVAGFGYATYNYEGDTLTVTANGDGTANVIFTNSANDLVTEGAPYKLGFGTYTDMNMTVTKTADGTYTMVGKDSVAIGMPGVSGARNYPYDSQYTVSDGKVTAKYTLAIMGGTTVTFTSTSKK